MGKILTVSRCLKLATLKLTCVEERQVWVNVDSSIIHIPILVFLKEHEIKVMSPMHIQDNWLYFDMHSFMYIR